MSSIIKVLDENIAKKIAAGEVVERPASVVKELVENSIDSKANLISIEIKNGGKDYISVTDNGSGILFSDSKLAFIRHATSKISSLDDLYNINQMGFRGEALYSISAVSKVTMMTKSKSEEYGSISKVNGGIIEENHEYGCPDGTIVIVEELFYNTPARKKFLGTTSGETSAISNIIQKYILSYPSISFKFVNNGKMIYFSPGDGDIKNAVNAVYGNQVAKNVVLIETNTKNNIWITGCMGNNSLLYKSRNNQVIFVNNRYIKDRRLAKAIEDTYHGLLMKHNYPFFVINIHIDPILVDVNVHPQKMNVAFSDLTAVIDTINFLLEPYISQIQGIIKSVEIRSKETTKNNTVSKEDNNEIKDQSIPFETNGTLHVSLSEIPTEKLNEIKSNNADECGSTYVLTDEIPDENYIEKKTDINSEIMDFSYKSSLLLDNNKQTSILKQNSTAEKIIYKQSEISTLKKDFKIIGTYINSFLLIESNSNLYIIDQHAAHERLIFEEYMKMYKNKKIVRQKLLIKQIIDVTYSDRLLIEENIDVFSSVGYTIEFVGDTQISISEVPQLLGQPRLNEFFKELLAKIQENNTDENMIIDTIITKSCKKAVKAGEKLSNKEIEALLDLIIDSDIKLTCPHGRPFVIVMTKYNLEKNFGRIV